jgi:hypothetical protein
MTSSPATGATRSAVWRRAPEEADMVRTAPHGHRVGGVGYGLLPLRSPTQLRKTDGSRRDVVASIAPTKAVHVSGAGRRRQRLT